MGLNVKFTRAHYVQMIVLSPIYPRYAIDIRTRGGRVNPFAGGNSRQYVEYIPGDCCTPHSPAIISSGYVTASAATSPVVAGGKSGQFVGYISGESCTPSDYITASAATSPVIAISPPPPSQMRYAEQRTDGNCCNLL